MAVPRPAAVARVVAPGLAVPAALGMGLQAESGDDVVGAGRVGHLARESWPTALGRPAWTARFPSARRSGIQHGDPSRRSPEDRCLELPETVTACLFDLDGVLTDTASVHRGAWKQMFDGFLGAGPTRPGSRSSPFTRPRLRALRRRATPARRDRVASSRSRGIDLPEGTPDDPPGTPTVHGLGNRKNDLVLRAARRERAWRCSTGSVRVRAGGAGRRAAHRGRVVERQHRRRCWSAAGIADLFEARIDGVVAAERRPGGQAGARHVPGRGRGARRAVPGQAAVFEDALAGVEAGRAGGFGLVVGVDRVGPARTSSLEHGADIVVGDLAELLDDGGDASSRARRPRHRARHARGTAAVHGRAVVRDRGELDLDGSPAPSRCSPCPTATSACGATSTRAIPTACPAPTSTRSTSCGRCRTREAGYGYPESGQTVINVTNGKLIRLLVDDEPFDVRYGDLDAPRAHASTCGPARSSRKVEWRSPAGDGVRIYVDAAGVAHPAGHRGHRVRGRGRSTSSLRIVVQSELVANEELPDAGPGPPHAPRSLERPLVDEEHTACEHRGADGPPHPAQRPAAWPPGMRHLVDGPENTDLDICELRRRVPARRSPPGCGRARSCGS